MDEIKQLATREVYRSQWMRVREDEVEFPSGARGTYSVVEKRDFVLVIPYVDDGFWLVEQFRYPVGSREWEFPQGGWPAGASGTQEELAVAELREETGLLADSLVHLGRLHTAYGYSAQGYDVYLATGLTPGAVDREVTEQDMIHEWRSVADVREMVRAGVLRDAHSLAALALFDLRADARGAPLGLGSAASIHDVLGGLTMEDLGLWSRLRSRLTYPNVTATLALFVALGTGGAYAATLIGADNIKDNAVRSRHIKNGEVKTADLGARAVTRDKIARGVIPTGLDTIVHTGPTLVVNPSGGDNSQVVECGAHEFAVGGGFFAADGVEVTASRPAFLTAANRATAWSISVHNPTGAGQNFGGYVVCASNSPIPRD